MKKHVHVAVGIVFDCLKEQADKGEGQILIAKRAEHQHQGGLWEFPGGKVESGESVQVALQRELEEELGLMTSVINMTPVISIPFHYPDKSVLLDVWAVYNEPDALIKAGLACSETSDLDVFELGTGLGGKEGQPLLWVKRSELDQYQFPEANVAILNVLMAAKDSSL